MRLGIIGLPQSGKATIFETLTKKTSEVENRFEKRIGTIRVPDQRVGFLSELYQPRKTTYAQIEYFLPGKAGSKKSANIWGQVRDCDAFVQVIRNFPGYEIEGVTPYQDFLNLDQDMMLADLVVVEKRLENFRLEKKRGRKVSGEELSLLEECLQNLENEIPLRKCPHLAQAPQLKGYTFVSAKPMLVLFNNQEDDDKLPLIEKLTAKEECMVIRGKLEHELAQMPKDEAADFLVEYKITQPAMDRVIEKSYELLGLISFFTVGEDEVKAWTIKNGTEAVDAADVIHSDIRKGFIRAETLFYDDLVAAGSYQNAKKKGVARLEGKTYQVRNGDIINFRFNV